MSLWDKIKNAILNATGMQNEADRITQDATQEAVNNTAQIVGQTVQNATGMQNEAQHTQQTVAKQHADNAHKVTQAKPSGPELPDDYLDWLLYNENNNIASNPSAHLGESAQAMLPPSTPVSPQEAAKEFLKGYLKENTWNILKGLSALSPGMSEEERKMVYDNAAAETQKQLETQREQEARQKELRAMVNGGKEAFVAYELDQLDPETRALYEHYVNTTQEERITEYIQEYVDAYNAEHFTRFTPEDLKLDSSLFVEDVRKSFKDVYDEHTLTWLEDFVSGFFTKDKALQDFYTQLNSEAASAFQTGADAIAKEKATEIEKSRDSIYDIVWNWDPNFSGQERLDVIQSLFKRQYTAPGIKETKPAFLLRNLNNLAETMDIFAGPTKAILQGLAYKDQTVKGNLQSLVAGTGGTFDWNTGDRLVDFALEMVSDPLDWIEMGAKGFIKASTKGLVTDAIVESLETFTSKVPKEFTQGMSAKALKQTLEDIAQSTNRGLKILDAAGMDELEQQAFKEVSEFLLERIDYASFNKGLYNNASRILKNTDGIPNLGYALVRTPNYKSLTSTQLDYHNILKGALENTLVSNSILGARKLAKFSDDAQRVLLLNGLGPVGALGVAGSLFNKTVAPVVVEALQKVNLHKAAKQRISPDELKDYLISKGLNVSNTSKTAIADTLEGQAKIDFLEKGELSFKDALELPNTLKLHAMKGAGHASYDAAIVSEQYEVIVLQLRRHMSKLNKVTDEASYNKALQEFLDYLGVANADEATDILYKFANVPEVSTQEMRMLIADTFDKKYGSWGATSLDIANRKEYQGISNIEALKENKEKFLDFEKFNKASETVEDTFTILEKGESLNSEEIQALLGAFTDILETKAYNKLQKNYDVVSDLALQFLEYLRNSTNNIYDIVNKKDFKEFQKVVSRMRTGFENSKEAPVIKIKDAYAPEKETPWAKLLDKTKLYKTAGSYISPKAKISLDDLEATDTYKQILYGKEYTKDSITKELSQHIPAIDEVYSYKKSFELLKDNGIPGLEQDVFKTVSGDSTVADAYTNIMVILEDAVKDRSITYTNLLELYSEVKKFNKLVLNNAAETKKRARASSLNLELYREQTKELSEEESWKKLLEMVRAEKEKTEDVPIDSLLVPELVAYPVQNLTTWCEGVIKTNAPRVYLDFPELKDIPKDVLQNASIKMYHLKLGNTATTKLYLDLNVDNTEDALNTFIENKQKLYKISDFFKRYSDYFPDSLADDTVIKEAITYTEVAYQQALLYQQLATFVKQHFNIDAQLTKKEITRAVDTLFDSTQNYYNIEPQCVDIDQLMHKASTMDLLTQARYTLGKDKSELVKNNITSASYAALRKIYQDYFDALEYLNRHSNIKIYATPSALEMTKAYKRIVSGKESSLAILEDLTKFQDKKSVHVMAEYLPRELTEAPIEPIDFNATDIAVIPEDYDFLLEFNEDRKDIIKLYFQKLTGNFIGDAAFRTELQEVLDIKKALAEYANDLYTVSDSVVNKINKQLKYNIVTTVTSNTFTDIDLRTGKSIYDPTHYILDAKGNFVKVSDLNSYNAIDAIRKKYPGYEVKSVTPSLRLLSDTDADKFVLKNNQDFFAVPADLNAIYDARFAFMQNSLKEAEYGLMHDAQSLLYKDGVGHLKTSITKADNTMHQVLNTIDHDFIFKYFPDTELKPMPVYIKYGRLINAEDPESIAKCFVATRKTHNYLIQQIKDAPNSSELFKELSDLYNKADIKTRILQDVKHPERFDINVAYDNGYRPLQDKLNSLSNEDPFTKFVNDEVKVDLEDPFSYAKLESDYDPQRILYEDPEDFGDYVKQLLQVTDMTTSDIFKLIEDPELSKLYYARGCDTKQLKIIYEETKECMDKFKDIFKEFTPEDATQFRNITNVYATEVQTSAIRKIFNMSPEVMQAYMVQNTPGYMLISLDKTNTNYFKRISELSEDATYKSKGINCRVENVSESKSYAIFYLDNTITKADVDAASKLDITKSFSSKFINPINVLHLKDDPNATKTTQERVQLLTEAFENVTNYNKASFDYSNKLFTLDHVDRSTLENIETILPPDIIGAYKVEGSINNILRNKYKSEMSYRMPNTLVFGDLEFRRTFTQTVTDDPVKAMYTKLRAAYKDVIDRSNFLNAYVNERITLNNLVDEYGVAETLRLLKHNDDLVGVYVTKRTKKFKGKEYTKLHIKSVELGNLDGKNIDSFLKLNPALVSRREGLKLEKIYNAPLLVTDNFAKVALTAQSIYKATILCTPSWLKNNFISTVLKDVIAGTTDVSEVPGRVAFMLDSFRIYTNYRNVYQDIINFSREMLNAEGRSADQITSIFNKRTIDAFFEQGLNQPNHLTKAEFYRFYDFENYGPTSVHKSLLKAQEENNIIYGHSLLGSLKHLDDRLDKSYGELWQEFSPNKKRLYKALQGAEDIAWKHPMAQAIMDANTSVESFYRFDTFRWESSGGANTSQAYKSVKQTHFDYNNDTPILKAIDFVFPFANFYMYNTLFWAEQMWKNPDVGRFVTSYLKQTGVFDVTQDDIDNNEYWVNALLAGGIQLSSGYTFTVNADFMDALNTLINPTDLLEATTLGRIVTTTQRFISQRNEIEEQYNVYLDLLKDEGVQSQPNYNKMVVDVERWHKDRLRGVFDYAMSGFKSYIPAVGGLVKRLDTIYSNVKTINPEYYSNVEEFFKDFTTSFLPDFFRQYKNLYYNYDGATYNKEYVNDREYELPGLEGYHTYHTTKRGVYNERIFKGANEGKATHDRVYYTVAYYDEEGTKHSFRTQNVYKALNVLTQENGVAISETAKALKENLNVKNPALKDLLDYKLDRYRYSYTNVEGQTEFVAMDKEDFINQVITDTQGTFIPIGGRAEKLYQEALLKKQQPSEIEYYDKKYWNVRIAFEYNGKTTEFIYKNIFDKNGNVINEENWRHMLVMLANKGIPANDLTKRLFNSNLVFELRNNKNELYQFANRSGIYAVQGYDGSYDRFFRKGQEDKAIAALMMNGTAKNQITEELLPSVKEVLNDPELLNNFDTEQGLYRLKHSFFGTVIITKDKEKAAELMANKGFVPVTDAAKEVAQTVTVAPRKQFTSYPKYHKYPSKSGTPKYRRPYTLYPKGMYTGTPPAPGSVKKPYVKRPIYFGPEHSEAYWQAKNGYTPKTGIASTKVVRRPRHRRPRARRPYNPTLRYRMR